jgi:hypothetical protein
MEKGGRSKHVKRIMAPRTTLHDHEKKLGANFSQPY